MDDASRRLFLSGTLAALAFDSCDSERHLPLASAEWSNAELSVDSP